MKHTASILLAATVALTAQATVYRAGFRQGRFWLNYSKTVPSFNQDTYAANSWDWTLSAMMCNVSGNAGAAGTSEVSGRSWDWQNYYGYAYDGEMWMEAGTTYTLGGNFDDGSAILIDGAVAWAQDNPGGTTSGYNNWKAPSSFTPTTTGWHPVKLLVWDWEGGKAITSGALSAVMWNTNGTTTASPQSDWSKFADDGSGTLFRARLADSYFTVDGITQSETGYTLTITSTAPQATVLTVFADASDKGETDTGWAVQSSPATFQAAETGSISVPWTDPSIPTLRVQLSGTDSSLAHYGDFWEWSDPIRYAMDPTVSAELTGVTGTSGTFDVTLGYDKEIAGMTPPAIVLKAFYGAADGGTDPDAWDSVEDFGAANTAGVTARALTGLAQGSVYYVRFAAKTADSDWIWTDAITFSTAGIFLADLPGNLCENDPTAQSFSVCRSLGSEAEALTVYLSYSGATAKVAGLPASVTLAAGSLSASVPFTMVDNALEDGDATLTIAIAANAAYLLGNPSTATIVLYDDETSADEIVWVGSAGDDKWETPANWSPARVPTAMDTAVFLDAGMSANETVTIDSAAVCRVLKISKLQTMTLGGTGTLQLGGIVRENLDGNEGNHTIGAKLLVYGIDGATNLWNLAGSGDVYASGDIALAASGIVIRKTGSARLRFGRDNMSYDGAWHIAEGNVYVDGSNRMRGEVTVGGEDTAAELNFSNNYCYHGNRPVSVLRNGRLYSEQGMNNSRISVLNVYDGGWARVGYFYLGAYTLRGGTIEGNGWSDAISTWPEYVTTYASDVPSYFRLSYTVNWWNPFTITVADGAAPVDLVMKSFSGDNADGTNNGDFSKTGPGVLKVTGNCTVNRSLKINAGTWLADNADSGCSRANVTVAAGATLGGIGSVLGTYYPDTQTVKVNGSSGNPGTLMPGSIDETTGTHIYGTLTVGAETCTNSVGLGNYCCLKVGVGPKDSETRLSPADKLSVHGSLAIGTNCSLDLVTNSAVLDTIAGGSYTIVEADEITGQFATVLKPENGWRIDYETESVDGMDVVKRIVLSVPYDGTVIFFQ